MKDLARTVVSSWVRTLAGLAADPHGLACVLDQGNRPTPGACPLRGGVAVIPIRVPALPVAGVLMLASTFPTGACAQADSSEIAGIAARLEAEATRILEDTGIPAISIALVRSGEVMWAGAFGYANVAAATPVTTDTYFSTGSTLKPVTAAAVMQLVDEGRVSLDEPVNSLLGPDRAIVGADDVTLRHLLGHHSGLEGPVDIVPLWNRASLPTAEETVAATRRTAEPATGYRYCNECYTLAAQVVELMSSLSYDAYLAEKIFAPLGVEVTSPTRPTPQVVERLALPYGEENGIAFPIEQIRTNVYAAGDAYLRPKDMAAFLAMLLNLGTYRERRVLSEASAREIMRPQFDGSSSGLGINSGEVNGHPVVTKNGIFTGYHTYMVGDPETRHGAYVVANSTAAGRVVASLARFALQLLWGQEPAPIPSVAGRR